MDTITTTTPGSILHASAIADNYRDISQYEIIKSKEFHYNSALNLTSPLSNSWNFFLKRSLDIFISLFLIILILSWLTPLLALLIKLSSRGPVFFRQQRNKNLGRVFTCIKFRTMIVNEDADTLSACENDKRITRIGNFLRKHHLDELPQLLNVLAGDMSVIGPRPHMIAENTKFENLVDKYSGRHAILPGMTGLAQSYGNFGSTTDIGKVKQRVDLDLYYIREWTFVMDLKILLRTIKLMLGF